MINKELKSRQNTEINNVLHTLFPLASTSRNKIVINKRQIYIR